MPADLAVIVMEQSQDELSAIVRQILQVDATPIGELTLRKIGRSAGSATAGIFHVAGRARTQAGESKWSAVLKVLGTPENLPTGTERDGSTEVDVYRSGVFAQLCGGIRAANCYAIQPKRDLLLLWMEDLTDAPQAPWSADHFIAAARHLGKFNAFWPEESLPQWDWLSRLGFRAEFTGSPHFQSVFERLDTQRDQPLMREFVSATSLEQLKQLWRDCDVLLTLAETTSKGVCHGDCHPKNLFPITGSNGNSYTIGIDWVKVGICNHGVDLGHMLASPAKWLELTPEEAALLREPILDAYLVGLTESGWSGSADGVRITYFVRLACGALRIANLVSRMVEDPRFIEQGQRLIGRPVAQIVPQWAQLLRFYLDCRDEALRIAERL